MLREWGDRYHLIGPYDAQRTEAELETPLRRVFARHLHEVHGIRSGATMKSKIRQRIVVVVGLLVVVAVLVGVKAGQIVTMVRAGESFVPPPQAVTSAKVQSAEWEATRAAVGTLDLQLPPERPLPREPDLPHASLQRQPHPVLQRVLQPLKGLGGRRKRRDGLVFGVGVRDEHVKELMLLCTLRRVDFHPP